MSRRSAEILKVIDSFLAILTKSLPRTTGTNRQSICRVCASEPRAGSRGRSGAWHSDCFFDRRLECTVAKVLRPGWSHHSACRASNSIAMQEPGTGPDVDRWIECETARRGGVRYPNQTRTPRGAPFPAWPRRGPYLSEKQLPGLSFSQREPGFFPGREPAEETSCAERSTLRVEKAAETTCGARRRGSTPIRSPRSGPRSKRR
jgi:hypothetical protein